MKKGTFYPRGGSLYEQLRSALRAPKTNESEYINFIENHPDWVCISDTNKVKDFGFVKLSLSKQDNINYKGLGSIKAYLHSDVGGDFHNGKKVKCLKLGLNEHGFVVTQITWK